MFENLREAEKHFVEIGEQLMDPSVSGDPEKLKNLMKEHKNLTPVIEKYREYIRAEKEMKEAARPDLLSLSSLLSLLKLRENVLSSYVEV